MITATGKGRLTFALPYLRNYLTDHPVTKALLTDDPRT